jgi:hypothetical protein
MESSSLKVGFGLVLTLKLIRQFYWLCSLVGWEDIVALLQPITKLGHFLHGQIWNSTWRTTSMLASYVPRPNLNIVDYLDYFNHSLFPLMLGTQLA